MSESFLGLLEKSQLLTTEQIAAAVESLGLRQDSNPKDVARSLVEQRLLTFFQANQLLRGHSRGFFIDRYKVLEILGSGGMGFVYVAEDPESHSRVALKVLSDRHKHDAGMRARFELEARAGLSLNDPHILRTLHLGHADDLYGEIHFLVMEFFEGINLHEFMQLYGPIPWPQACDFARQAAKGLRHAHAAGLVHRDIKPTNLIVDQNGFVKILDFGLALNRDAAEQDEFSLAMVFGQQCLGTEDYIAPEQTLDSFAVDARADVYSLGCTLYQMLAGVVPYPFDTTAQKMHARRTTDPQPLHELVPDLPAGVSQLVSRMMARDPANRPPSADSVIASLRRWARCAPIEFDFPQILSRRAAEARYRLNLERRARPPGSSVSAIRDPAVSSLIGPPQANIETAVRDETLPRRSAIVLVETNELQSSSEAQEGELLSTAERCQQVKVPEGAPLALVPLDGGPAVPLRSGRIVIGRHPRCDVTLASPRVSSKHCELVCEGTWWRLRDLGSKNGIKVNGTPVTDQLLWPGDQLTIADVVQFRVESPAGTVRRRRRLWPAIGTALLAAAAGIAWWLLR